MMGKGDSGGQEKKEARQRTMALPPLSVQSGFLVLAGRKKGGRDFGKKIPGVGFLRKGGGFRPEFQEERPDDLDAFVFFGKGRNDLDAVFRLECWTGNSVDIIAVHCQAISHHQVPGKRIRRVGNDHKCTVFPVMIESSPSQDGNHFPRGLLADRGAVCGKGGQVDQNADISGGSQFLEMNNDAAEQFSGLDRRSLFFVVDPARVARNRERSCQSQDDSENQLEQGGKDSLTEYVVRFSYDVRHRNLSCDQVLKHA